MEQHDNGPKSLHHVSVNLNSMRESLNRIYGVNDALLTTLHDGSGVMAVLPMGMNGLSNAVIVNADGSARCYLQVPSDFQDGLGFYDAYYVNGEMTAIFVFSTRDFAFVIDEKTGQVIRTYETR